MQRASYKSDLTDQEWAEIAPFLERRDKRGRKQKYELREIANAIYYVIVTGAQWRNIPHDFPPWDSVYWHFRKWKKNEAIKDLQYPSDDAPMNMHSLPGIMASRRTHAVIITIITDHLSTSSSKP